MSATKIIVSYDGTNNEDDASPSGASSPAPARRSRSRMSVTTRSPSPSARCSLSRRLRRCWQRGVELLGVPAATHVVADRSTPEGLRALAEREGADAIVFCSDSHTAPRHVTVGNSAQRLLDGGRFAIAIASAGLAGGEGEPVQRIAVTEDPTDPSAQATADALAQAIGASVSPAARGHDADLLVLGSRPEAGQGQVALSAAALSLVEDDAGAVLVVPRGVALSFGVTASVGA